MIYRERALSLTRARGIARARDFKAAGIPLVYLKRLTDAGDLVRLGRGLYQDPERVGEDVAHNLAEAARLVPNGVISLVSALRQHELTTQLPHAVWMTIHHKARTPNAAGLRLEIVRATGEVLTAGVEHVRVEGVDGTDLWRGEDGRRLLQAPPPRRRGRRHRSASRRPAAKKDHPE